ncbi:OPT oligopeptide transporter protein-domain-containing protein [Coemansia spiralis]|nr:OPT oligopeptide transporter protein-domain-containing protein [Coemansia spiralis]
MLGSAVKHLDSGFGAQPSLTFRVLLLGTVFSCALGFVNMYYWFRSNPITLGIPVAQLLSLPAGWILSQALPKRKFNTFGMHWSMNPGPFSMKEHVLISVFANASTGTAYALDIIVARRFWIAPPLSFGAGVLVALASQLAGYSFSGLFHCFLVDPEAMVWPSTLVSVMLFRTLQSMLPQKTCQMFSPPSADVRALQSSRLRLFLIAFAASFAWYFVPGWIFPTLTMLPILCFIAPKSIYANQLGDGYNGLGMLALTLDWSTISNAYTGSPLATPWSAACNLSVGFVLVMWVITPIGYYANVWDAQSLPIYTNQLYDVDGNEYNVSRVLADGRLNTAAYEAYGPMHMSFQFLIMYGFCFMGITCLLTHVALYHGQDIWQTIQKIYSGTRAKFSNRVLNYSSPPTHVPIYWYIVLFIATMAMGLASCQIFELLPWYGFLLAICLAGVLTLPVGLVEAVSNFQYALGVVTELIAGYLWPGEPTYNASFKMFGYVTMKQALMLTKDQKLGHYMKVPPRHLFICQILGTIIAVFVQLGTAFWLMNSVENICTDDGFPFTCRQGRLFYSTMVIWGVFGPQRQFSSRYSVLYWLFLVGIFLPLPFWVLKRKYPQSVWHYVNIPVALTYIGYMPNAPTHDFVMFTLFCFLFNYVLLKYKSVWWQKYNFTLTAALDTGLAISGIVSYFALQNNVHVSWWGTRNHCPLSKDPFVKHHNRIP